MTYEQNETQQLVGTAKNSIFLINFFFIMMIIGILLASNGCVTLEPAGPTNESVEQRLSELQNQSVEKQSQGYDLSEVEYYGKKASQSYDKGDYETADKFLNEAFNALESAKISTVTLSSAQLNQGWISDGPIYEVNLDFYLTPYYSAFTFLTQLISIGIPQKSIGSLKDLGINTIYLMPIWESVAEHPYSIINHYNINFTRYGSESELVNLVNTAHNNNMKIIFDLVICQTPDDSYIYNETVNNNKTWILHVYNYTRLNASFDYNLTLHSDGNITRNYTRPTTGETIEQLIARKLSDGRIILRHHPHYAWGWAVNMTNPDVIKYFAEVAEYYVRKYDIDGWRVDAPQNNYNQSLFNELNLGDHSATELLRAVKTNITAVKNDAILYAEWMGPTCEADYNCEPLFDNMSEISYNYPFGGWLKPVPPLPENPTCENTMFEYKNAFLNNIVTNNASSAELVEFLTTQKINNRTRSNFIETHDSFRVQCAFPDQHKSLLVLISTITGVPMINNGQEIGATLPRSINWGSPDNELRDFYKKVFKIRKENDALKYGNISNVWNSGNKTYAYLRSYNNNHVVTVINFYNYSVSSTLNLSVGDMEIDPNALYTLYDMLNDEYFIVKGMELSNYEVNLPAYGARILVLKSGVNLVYNVTIS
ncbi:MAG: alpha-amylase family glycosyl hydrolase [Methanosarcinales archaeon]